MTRLIVPCLLLLIACSGPRPEPAPKPVVPAPKSGPADQLIELSGANDRNSDRFDLAGGSYEALWSLKDRETVRGCPFFASLRPETADARPVDLVTADGERSSEGRNPVHGIKPGRYWLQVRSSCPEWHLSLSPA